MLKDTANDYFSGAGGLSTGARLAGLKVKVALNHWKRACITHKANHPETEHVCQDAGLYDPQKLPRTPWFLAAPECIGHTPARGKEAPRHDKSRATAFCVTRYAELMQPQIILVENVPQFLEWQLYPHWRAMLETLGYAVSENVLCASEFGVAQERTRLLLLAVRDVRTAPTIVSPRLPKRGAIDVIDFTKGRWSPVAKHVKATRARVAQGRADGYGDRFVFPYYKSGSGETGRSIHRPIGTLTTVARWGVVDGDLMRMVSVDECREFMSFPEGYVLTGTQREQHHQLGNAVCPQMAAEAIRQVREALA